MTTGSFISTETPQRYVQSTRFLTIQGIMDKYHLQPYEIEKIKCELSNKKFRDILFHFPDGPRYDIALNLIATSG